MAGGNFGPFHLQNRTAWDRLVSQKSRFAKAADDDELINPLKTVDGKLGWLSKGVQGQNLLCLAAGGGRQSALYAAAGAKVTVVDISPKMLELDREVARERKLNIKTIEASMDDLRMIADQIFDIVIQPVSTCYVPAIIPVFKEVARVLKSSGIYISQHKSPANLQSDVENKKGGYRIREKYYQPNTSPLPGVSGSRLREDQTAEFIHRWEEIIGGMCRAGFLIEDLVEPNHARAGANDGEFGHRCQYIAPYVRIKAIRKSAQGSTSTSLLLPE
ncbi:MAG: class I SAM-dependent methyltransferase [Planctomycetota bacterium]|nr:class I SAM-dependent methyltransferase [Planctomycetota bacterium]